MAPAPVPLPQQRPAGGPGGSGGRPNRLPAIIGGSVAVIAIAVIVVLIVAMNGSGSDDNAGGNGGTSSAPATVTSTTPTTTTGADSIVKGDQSRTIDQDKCRDAHNDLINPNDPDVVTMPDFTSIYVDSVVACIQAAGWTYTTKYVDEQQWGEGTVTSQDPKYLDDYNPKTDGKITIWVSTGKGAS